MIQKILACPETLIDLFLNPGWNGDKHNLERRQEALGKLKELLEADKIILYVPRELITAVHLIVSAGENERTASYVVSQILKFGSGICGVDYERALEQASRLVADEEGIELYEAVLPFYASYLKLDAVVVNSLLYPSIRKVIDEKKRFFPEASNRILQVETLNSYLTEYPLQNSPVKNWIHVVTPQNNIIRLPIDSTPIDFAYYIHTDIGDQCIGAQVNGNKVSLSKKLRDYDTVEIIRGIRAEPKEEWLTFAKTQYTKKKIYRGLKRLWTRKGWKITKQAFGNNIRAYRQKLENIAEDNYWSLDELMSKVGSGNIGIDLLQSEISKLDSKQVHKDAVCINPHDYSIPGNGDITWHLASCCFPLPGDPITGILNSHKKTIRVHKSSCPNLKNVKSEKICSPAWNCGYCSVKFSLFMNDKPDTLRPVLDLLAEILTARSSKPDVRDLQISKDGTARAIVRIPVASRQDLDGIISQIKSMPGVLKIKVTKLTPVEKKNAD